MRKRQRILKQRLGTFVDVFADTKSYPIHKSAVSMIRGERRDYQNPVAWVAWIRRYAALMHVLRPQASDAASLSGPIQPVIRWWWFLWWRWRFAKSRATQEQGPHPPGTCLLGGSL